jgi:hypothetical protein
MAGIKPVEERGARAADVQITGGRRSESNTRFHGFNLTTDEHGLTRIKCLAETKNVGGAGPGSAEVPPASKWKGFATKHAGETSVAAWL